MFVLEKSLTHGGRGAGLSHPQLISRMDKLAGDTKEGGVWRQGKHSGATQQAGGKTTKNLMKSKKGKM